MNPIALVTFWCFRTKPDLASRAREIIRRSLKVEGVIDELIDGLRRAGLEIEEHRAFG